MVANAHPVVSTPPKSERDRRILLGLAGRIDASDAGAHNNLGVLYFNKGMLEEAVGEFERALEVDPRMQVAQRNLDIAYFATGFYPRVMAELRERLRAEPEDSVARRRLARLCATSGDREGAIRELTLLLAADPHDLATLRQLGRVEKDAGHFDAALVWYERAREVDPSSAVLRFHIGELHYHRGMTGEARVELETAIHLRPDFADAHHLLAFVLGDLGEVQLASEAAARARELNPTFGRAETSLSLDRYNPARYGELMGESGPRPTALTDRYLARYHLGIAFRQKGLYVEAIRELERALEGGEDRALVRQAIAELHLIRGETAAAAGLYRELLDEDDESPKLWNELGVCFHLQGEADQAETHYRLAIQRDPDYPLAWSNLGVARSHRGDGSGAAECFARATGLDRSFADGWCNAGLTAERTGHERTALMAYRSAIAADEGCVPAWLGVARILGEGGRFDDARNVLARAVEADPASAAARYQLGYVLTRLGDHEGALRETKEAMALDPFYPEPRHRLSIDLQFEYAEVLAPELDAARRAPERVGSFDLDSKELGALFDALAPAPDPISVADDGDDGDALALARDYLSKGLLGRAGAEVRRALAAGADPLDAALLTGEILQREELDGEALERFDAALARMEGTPWSTRQEAAWLGRARALLRLGRLEAALDSARELEAGAPGHPEALRIRACLCNEAVKNHFEEVLRGVYPDPEKDN